MKTQKRAHLSDWGSEEQTKLKNAHRNRTFFETAKSMGMSEVEASEICADLTKQRNLIRDLILWSIIIVIFLTTVHLVTLGLIKSGVGLPMIVISTPVFPTISTEIPSPTIPMTPIIIEPTATIDATTLGVIIMGYHNDFLMVDFPTIAHIEGGCQEATQWETVGGQVQVYFDQDYNGVWDYNFLYFARENGIELSYGGPVLAAEMVYQIIGPGGNYKIAQCNGYIYKQTIQAPFIQ